MSSQTKTQMIFWAAKQKPKCVGVALFLQGSRLQTPGQIEFFQVGFLSSQTKPHVAFGSNQSSLYQLRLFHIWTVPARSRRKAAQGMRPMRAMVKDVAPAQGSRVFKRSGRWSEFLSGVGEGCCSGDIILASRNIRLKKCIWDWREGFESNSDKERDWDRTRERWKWGEGERKN